MKHKKIKRDLIFRVEPLVYMRNPAVSRPLMHAMSYWDILALPSRSGALRGVEQGKAFRVSSISVAGRDRYL